MKVYINGQLYDKAEAKVSVYDHGLLYGDGVFEGIRLYAGKIFKLAEHIDRLYESARCIALTIPLTKEQFADAVKKTVAASGLTDGYIRPVVTRGVGDLGIDPKKCKQAEVIIIVDRITLYPPETYENGMAIITASTIRNHPNAVNPRIKSLNYLNNILAKIEANLAGCQEALMLNHLGQVAECTADNVFVVKGGVLKTPTLDAGALEGVTRNTVMDLARAAGIPVQELPLHRHDIYTADECFLTGTGAEIVPVIQCDARAIGSGKPGPITRQLMERYRKITRE